MTQLNKVTVRNALNLAMEEEMEANPDIIILGEEVAQYQGAYKITQGLLEKFGPLRVIDTPITEHGFAGIAIGAAFAGLRPIVEFMTFNFAMQAIDQIINSAAKTSYMSGGQIKCPIVFRGPNGAAARVAAQHSQCFSAWYSHVPGLKVIAPFSASDSAGLLKSAIRDDGPVVFLENEILYGQQFDITSDDSENYEIGKAKLLLEGEDITLISYSISLTSALSVAEKLADQFGIKAEVIDLRSLRPLDEDAILKSAEKTGRVVIIEESWGFAGVGRSIAALIMEKRFDFLDAPVKTISGKDCPLPYAQNLEKLALPSENEIMQACKEVLYID